MIEGAGKFHFALITNMSRLFARQLGYKRWHKYHCDSCLLFYKSEKKFKSHRNDCLKINKTPIVFPEEDYIYFKNVERSIRRPFVIYGDCESFLIPTSEGKLTGTIQRHQLFSVGLYFQSDYPELIESKYEVKRGPKAAEWFVDRLIHYAQAIHHIIKYTNYEMIMNTRDKLKFIIASKCYLCDKPFTRKNYKVRDHSHLNYGQYLGCSHLLCNLKAKKNYMVPVIFHNLFGYDMHLLIKSLAKRMTKIRVIARTMEKYVTLTLYVPGTYVRLHLIDSFKFLPGSLSSLSKLLPLENKQLIIDEFPENYSLLMEKLSYPYEYTTGWNVLEETQLPPIEKFYSQLTEESISESEYEHTKLVWHTFGIKNLGQMADLYLKIDVMLLCSIFENFRSECLKIHKLDPCYYVTLPAFSWDSMLRYTKVRIKLIKNLEMLSMINKGIRGGFSCAIKKYAKSNNQFIADYNPDLPTTHIIYLDLNNLYGGIMMQHFAYRGFRWVRQVDKFDIFANQDKKIGYILEVDVEIPIHAHDRLKDLPPLLTHEDFGNGLKLVGTLYPKKRYVVHIDMLKFAVELGVIVTKIHRVLRFYQRPFLRSYMNLNTRLRKRAKNDFIKNLCKLKNNSIFGKTLQQNRNHENIVLATNWKQAERLIAKPTFQRAVIFDRNLVAIHLRKTKVLLNQPTIIGFSVLEKAKVTLMNWHYNFIVPKLRVNLLYTGEFFCL